MVSSKTFALILASIVLAAPAVAGEIDEVISLDDAALEAELPRVTQCAIVNIKPLGFNPNCMSSPGAIIYNVGGAVEG